MGPEGYKLTKEDLRRSLSARLDIWSADERRLRRFSFPSSDNPCKSRTPGTCCRELVGLDPQDPLPESGFSSNLSPILSTPFSSMEFWRQPLTLLLGRSGRL